MDSVAIKRDIGSLVGIPISRHGGRGFRLEGEGKQSDLTPVLLLVPDPVTVADLAPEIARAQHALVADLAHAGAPSPRSSVPYARHALRLRRFIRTERKIIDRVGPRFRFPRAGWPSPAVNEARPKPKRGRSGVTVTEAGPTTARAPASILDNLEQRLGAISRVVAIACVCGMLFVAAVTMVDVVLRWVANEPIAAMNEIVQMTFSVAIAACIPAGMAQRVNLKIDLVARYFNPTVHAWFEALGSACLWLFYAALAMGIGIYAGALALDDKATIILGLPEAPFMYGVSALFGFGALLQAIIVLNDARRAAAMGPAGILGAAVVSAAIAGVASICGPRNVDAIASWAGDHVGLTLILIFVAMWLATLVLIPIAAIMGIVGVVSSALFVGLAPSMSAASTEVTDFLGSPQLATLPLFLMMGSFAAGRRRR